MLLGVVVMPAMVLVRRQDQLGSRLAGYSACVAGVGGARASALRLGADKSQIFERHLVGAQGGGALTAWFIGQNTDRPLSTVFQNLALCRSTSSRSWPASSTRATSSYLPRDHLRGAVRATRVLERGGEVAMNAPSYV